MQILDFIRTLDNEFDGYIIIFDEGKRIELHKDDVPFSILMKNVYTWNVEEYEGYPCIKIWTE